MTTPYIQNGIKQILGEPRVYESSGAKNNKLSTNTGGVAAIEFALIAPILMIMLLTLVDLSILVVEKMRLDQFTRSVSSKVVSEHSSLEFNMIESGIISNFYSNTDVLPVVVITNGCFCDVTSVQCDYQCNEYSGDQIPDVRIVINSTLSTDLLLLGKQELTSELEIQIR